MPDSSQLKLLNYKDLTFLWNKTNIFQFLRTCSGQIRFVFLMEKQDFYEQISSCLGWRHLTNSSSFVWDSDWLFLVHGPSSLLQSISAIGEDEHAYCRWQHGPLHLHPDGPDSHRLEHQTGIWWDTETTKPRNSSSWTCNWYQWGWVQAFWM